MSTIGYSASGLSAAEMRSAGTNLPRPDGVGKFSMNTTGSPGSPSFTHGYVTDDSLSRRSQVIPAIESMQVLISLNASLGWLKYQSTPIRRASSLMIQKSSRASPG